MNQEIADLKEDFKDFKSDSEKLRIELNAQEFDECDLDLMEENFNGGSHNIMIDCMQKRLDKYCENIGVKDGVVLDSEHADCENMNYARYDHGNKQSKNMSHKVIFNQASTRFPV